MDEQNKQFDNRESTEQTETGPKTTGSDSVSGGNSKAQGLSATALAVVVVVALTVVAGGIYMYQGGGGAFTDQRGDTSGQASSEYPEVVAVVNGQDVEQEDFLLSLSQVQQVATQQGANLNDPTVVAQVQNQALDILINTTLLAQAAQESGVEVTDEMVLTELETVTGQFETQEAFAEALVEAGLTTEQLEENLREKLLVDMYLANNEQMEAVVVTEAEVAEAYEGLSSQNTELPPLEEISGVLEEQLLAQKQQQAVEALIQSLKAEADIEIQLGT